VDSLHGTRLDAPSSTEELEEAHQAGDVERERGGRGVVPTREEAPALGRRDLLRVRSSADASSREAGGAACLLPQMVAGGPPPGAIRVLLADGDSLFARELMRTLSAEERFDIVGCARDGREAVELATSLLPDVVLMAMEMPALDAIEATRRIRARVPSARVFLMGSSDQLDAVDPALAAGAAGFVRRSSASTELAATIFGLAVVVAFDRTALAQGRAEPPVSR
jgi:CheY-like chemotaxis protein